MTVTDETEAEDVETESEAEPAAEDVASDVVEEQQPRRPWLRRVLLAR